MAAFTNTLLLSLAALISAAAAAASGGFTVDLLHRDSPQSPMYNPLENRTQRLQNALRRSVSRAHSISRTLSRNTLAAAGDSAEAPIIAGSGEYLVKINIGTPSFPIVAIADTGSDVIWTQCEPCTDCYEQTAPLFDPKKSSTYKEVPCSAAVCSKVGYGDQSHTTGDIATETVTLDATNGRKVAIPKTIIGCGHDNGGTFSANSSGIVGLGGGPASLITQLGSTISGKFSYCLPPFGAPKPSTLSFGQNAVVSGGVSTPLISDPSTPTFYYLHIDAISVGTTRIPFVGGGSSTAATSSEGNIIIDSGTTLTLIPSGVQSQVADALSSQVSGGTATLVQDLAPCYKVDGAGLKVPTVTVHFDGGDVELKDGNVFIEVADDVFCSAFLASDSLSIYGNVAQQNFLVGYDSQGGSLTFKATDCSGGAADVDN
ncbi:Aspartic proteinase CDR1 [Linum perenne]